MAELRRSREQRRELVGGWPGSSLTQAQYCERHGISTGSLYRWRAVFGGEHPAGGGLANLGKDRGTSGEAARQRLARIRELLDRER